MVEENVSILTAEDTLTLSGDTWEVVVASLGIISEMLWLCGRNRETVLDVKSHGMTKFVWDVPKLVLLRKKSTFSILMAEDPMTLAGGTRMVVVENWRWLWVFVGDQICNCHDKSKVNFSKKDGPNSCVFNLSRLFVDEHAPISIILKLVDKLNPERGARRLTVYRLCLVGGW